MSMKVNKVLPLPAELKEEYPLSEEPLLLLCKIIIYSRPICKIGLIFL